MKKIKKTLLILIATILLFVPVGNTIFAQEGIIARPLRDIDDHRINVSKENVSYTYEWGTFARVSPDITGLKGNEIRSDKVEKKSVVVTGDISGLNIQTSTIKENKIGFTLTMPANGTYYMGYRVYYKVERGTRVSRNVLGTILSKKNYTVKTPIKEEYRLIKVR